MTGSEKFFVWFISFLVFLLILFIGYKISYKLGIKKALYRTTYILLCIIFAFVLSPVVNNVIFNLDLSSLDITLTYRGESFFTLIDYIEEVIAHNDFLNDLYVYFPSLKNLFMDFPEVLLAPITYVLFFIIFLILWMPLYLYLSYKRKRKPLYDKKDNDKYRGWAGLLGCLQCVFLFSVILTPINGINRIYRSSIEDTLDEEYDSLCEEHEALQRYSKYCELIDVYNSTIFAHIGSKWSINSYVFNSLTRIYYEGEYTNLSKEASLIIKSSVVLGQSGLLDNIEDDSEVIPVSLIINNTLSDEDIDIIVETLSESKYSDDLLVELGVLAANTLSDMVKDFLGYEEFVIDFTMTNEEIINEVKVILKAIKLLSGSNLLSQVLNAKDVIIDFIENVPDYLIDDFVVFDFLVNLVNTFDLDDFEVFCEFLFESEIFRRIVPYILDTFFDHFGFSFVTSQNEVMTCLHHFLDFGRMLKNHQPTDFFDLMHKLTQREVLILANSFEEVSNAEESKAFTDFLLSAVLGGFGSYSISDIYAIDDWEKEAPVVKEFCDIIHNYRVKGEVDVGEVLGFLASNHNSKVAELLIDIVQRNLDLFIEVVLTGREF